MMFLAAAAALVLTDARFEGRASARLETRARTATANDAPVGATAPPDAAGDAELTPTLFGAVDNLGGRIALSYSPTLRVRQPYLESTEDGRGGRRTEVNHFQSFEARWTREGRPSPYLLENFYFGRVDLAVQRGATPFALGQVSQVAVDVNGGVIWPLSKLIKLDTSAGYNYGAGVGPNSGAALPTVRAYRGRARLEAQASPLDVLTSQLDTTYSEFPGLLSSSTFVSGAQRWRRQLIPSTALELGVLAGVIYGSYLPPAPADQPADESTRIRAVNFAPGGDAVVTNRINTGPHVWNFEGGVRVSPFIDRYLATAFNRGEIFTTIAYAFRERWVSSVRGGVARSLTPVNVRGTTDATDVLTTYVEGRTGYWAPRFWHVDLSGQNSTFVIGNNTVNNWVVSLSLTLFAEGQI